MDEYDVTYAIEDFVDELIRKAAGDEDTNVNLYQTRLIKALREFKNGKDA